jgi:membrane protein implicated in regulation of membrane protease activity
MGLISHLIATLGPWSWWVLGLLLAVVEVLAPGTFFIWFAIAAILVGTLALFVDVSWQVELVLFVVIAVIAVFVGRRFYGGAGRAPEKGLLNDRVARQIGRIATLDTALSGGSGHVRLDDSQWRVEGPDLPAGSRVRITGFRDGRLQVEPAPPGA